MKPKHRSKGPPPKSPIFLRVLPFALAAFMGVAVAVYCMSWYFQAAFARQAVEQLIANVNSHQQVITYSAIETGGFPGDVYVHIRQPRFSTHAATAAAPGKQPDWIEDVSLGGSLSIGINMLSNRFTVSVQGPVTYTSIIGQAQSGMLTQPRGPVSCMLALDRRQGLTGGMWDLEGFSRETLDDLMREFRSLQCNAPGYTITDTGTHEVAASAGPFMLRFATRPEQGSMRSTEFYAKVTDLEFTQRMNAALNAQLAAIYGGTELPNIDMAAYGKQNIDIAFQMRGPADNRAFSDDTPFVVSIPRLNITNALYNTSSNLQLENRVSGNARGITFLLNSDSSFTQAYDKYLADYMRIVVARIKNSSDPELAQMKATLAPFSALQAADLLDPAMPKLHSFGNITLHANATLEGDKVLRNRRLAIGTMEVSTTPYGVSLQGTATLPDGSKPPQNANFTLNCRNCLMLVDDVAHYAQHLQQSVDTLDHDMAGTPLYLSPQLAQGIEAFLTALGEKRRDPATGAESLAFTLVSDSAGRLSLNGKAPQEVMQLYNADIAPNLPVLTPKAQPHEATAPLPAY